nr:hypothetical protein [Rickettsia sp. TH2014]
MIFCAFSPPVTVASLFATSIVPIVLLLPGVPVILIGAGLFSFKVPSLAFSPEISVAGSRLRIAV